MLSCFAREKARGAKVGRIAPGVLHPTAVTYRSITYSLSFFGTVAPQHENGSREDRAKFACLRPLSDQGRWWWFDGGGSGFVAEEVRAGARAGARTAVRAR